MCLLMVYCVILRIFSNLEICSITYRTAKGFLVSLFDRRRTDMIRTSIFRPCERNVADSREYNTHNTIRTSPVVFLYSFNLLFINLFPMSSPLCFSLTRRLFSQLARKSTRQLSNIATSLGRSSASPRTSQERSLSIT